MHACFLYYFDLIICLLASIGGTSFQVDNRIYRCDSRVWKGEAKASTDFKFSSDHLSLPFWELKHIRVCNGNSTASTWEMGWISLELWVCRALLCRGYQCLSLNIWIFCMSIRMNKAVPWLWLEYTVQWFQEKGKNIHFDSDVLGENKEALPEKTDLVEFCCHLVYRLLSGSAFHWVFCILGFTWQVELSLGASTWWPLPSLVLLVELSEVLISGKIWSMTQPLEEWGLQFYHSKSAVKESSSV